ncbi:uncharacterized protein LOC62_04G005329 [Vanrija pseudolonga]|uniref:F-box domain-containing protein n=1 Tax=Vanrija pseudolonga TaxID=143232 RepID=A0AAF1BL62_9TREE|nr:hypothetical protein LOC62_04G005329 [Vanrija pseudolonga]
MAHTLIHDGHPDIIEAMVRHLTDLDTLLALRRTCRAFRAGVDSELYAHVELHSLPQSSLGGGPPSEPALVMTLPSETHIKVPPYTSHTPPKDVSKVRARLAFPVLPFNPAAVRSLDLVTVHGLSMSQVHAFTSLHTLRTDYGLDSGATAFQPHTLVHTVWVENGERLVLAPSVRRLVLHVSFVGPIWPEDLVLAFSFVRYPTEETTYPQVAAWLLGALLSGRTTAKQITIVGMEVLLERNAENFATWLRDNRVLFTATLDGDPRVALALVDEVLRRARFISRAQWHQELGGRRLTEGSVLTPRQGPLISKEATRIWMNRQATSMARLGGR